MKFDRIVEFVGRVRKLGKQGGCKKCGESRSRLVLRGQPTLSAMYRGGASIAEIKRAIRSRGWYCRQCANKVGGITAAATIREQFSLTSQGEKGRQKAAFASAKEEGRVPEGYDVDPSGIGWIKIESS